MKINVSSPFSLCSLNGSDGGGSLSGYVLWGKKKEYREALGALFPLKRVA
jgi:hypothetical protein